jgi:hypothetical protein
MTAASPRAEGDSGPGVGLACKIKRTAASSASSALLWLRRIVVHFSMLHQYLASNISKFAAGHLQQAVMAVCRLFPYFVNKTKRVTLYRRNVGCCKRALALLRQLPPGCLLATVVSHILLFESAFAVQQCRTPCQIMSVKAMNCNNTSATRRLKTVDVHRTSRSKLYIPPTGRSNMGGHLQKCHGNKLLNCTYSTLRLSTNITRHTLLYKKLLSKRSRAQ